MSDLMAARTTMALSLGFHIIFACIGMVMPALMTRAHARWLKTGDDSAWRLTRLWMRGTAIFFATGAVTGTVLSFELGLLWPEFMRHAGPIIGMPFSLEGAAFFVEAIALGIYMYGWERLRPRLHWWCGVVVCCAGVASGVLVVAANGWMNSPTGFEWTANGAINVDPWAAMANAAWGSQAVHMVVGAFQAVAFAVAGVHAFLLLKGREPALQRLALSLVLPIAIAASLAQPLVGHWAAQDIAERQPMKLAAAEAHFHTGPRAPLLIGGWPDEEAQTVCCGIEIPGGLSFLAFNDFDAVVQGLDQIPRDEWPPVAVVHGAFQTMVGLGSWMAAFSALLAFLWWRRRTLFGDPKRRRLLWLIVLTAPMGFIAIEAGWVVTEVGRQPWIIYKVMKTKDAISPIPGQVWHLVAFGLLYLAVGVGSLLAWRSQIRNAAQITAPSDAIRAWRTGGEA